MPNRCFLCKTEEEMRDHVPLHCPKACILWQLVFALFNVQWVMHSLMRGMLLSWSHSFVGKKRKMTWKVAPLCLFWFIWKERNRRTFENCKSLDQRIKIFFRIIFGIGLDCTLGMVLCR